MQNCSNSIANALELLLSCGNHSNDAYHDALSQQQQAT